MSRHYLIAANWKMNPAPAGFDTLHSAYKSHEHVDVVVFPSALDIPQCVSATLITGGQCGHAADCGAYTGDINMRMLKAAGCTYVLCGHSERRKYHHQTDLLVAGEVKAALAAELVPIVCIGETTLEHRQGHAKEAIQRQLQAIPTETSIIAYEPTWAIGTGNTATPEIIEDMHSFIRTLPGRKNVRLLYGGSVTAQNAAAILCLPDVDGALVGGASLKPTEFAAIVAAAQGLSTQ
jgi:triosephosphate isomerase (TIM)